ncbi:MAG TPA: hypothetical protein VLA88_00720 [Candidatus Saccharimonadales bacterium]|nr:hypothetical protein [Candidatus Saccharimonadales bacterium]
MNTDKTIGLESAHKQIDRIVYLSSLVSDSRHIDAYLDPLRRITAVGSSDETTLLDPKVALTLNRIESELTEYLVKTEPLRSFTPESLQQRVYERFEAPKLIRSLRWQTTGIIALTLVVVGFVVNLPFSTISVRLDVGLVLGIAVCYLGGLFLFLSALKHFSAEAARAYLWFSLGFAIGSVSLLINAILTLIYEAHTPWDKLWLLNFGVYAQYIALYTGSAKLANLQGVKSRLTNGWVVGLISLTTGALLLMPPVGREVEAVSGLVLPLVGMALILTIAAAELIRKIWKTSTPLYKAPNKALWFTFTAAALGWFVYGVSQFLPRALAKPMGELKISSLFFIVATILLVWSAYRFNKLSRY